MPVSASRKLDRPEASLNDYDLFIELSKIHDKLPQPHSLNPSPTDLSPKIDGDSNLSCLILN